MHCYSVLLCVDNGGQCFDLGCPSYVEVEYVLKVTLRLNARFVRHVYCLVAGCSLVLTQGVYGREKIVFK